MSASQASAERGVEARSSGPMAMLGTICTRGAVAGIAAGLIFLVANMGWAVHDDKPAAAPLIDISTIFHTQDTPNPVTAAAFGPDNLAVGLVTHLTLAMLFGIGFGLLAGRFARSNAAVLGGGIAYGLALYVVNFQILGRTAFPWFTDSMGPPQGFEVFIHAVFGLLLVPFFVGLIPGPQAASVEGGRSASRRFAPEHLAVDT
jgi:uncharacterized membrane protein YagU involved in acid resistance